MEIVIANDENEPEAAKKVAKELLEDNSINGIKRIIGHYASESTFAAQEIYKGKDIAVVSSTSATSFLRDRKLVGDIFLELLVIRKKPHKNM